MHMIKATLDMVSGRQRGREIVEQAVANRADHLDVCLATGEKYPCHQGTLRRELRAWETYSHGYSRSTVLFVCFFNLKDNTLSRVHEINHINCETKVTVLFG